MEKTQLVVIGAGPGGYAAAFHAADLGLQTTLVDLETNPGGVCLYRGCIPSKALLHAARVINESQDAREIGIEFGEPEVDLKKLRAWKEGVVAKLTGGLGGLSKQRGVSFIQGSAEFLDPRTLKITKAGGASERLGFEHAVVATGSRPVKLPFLPDSPAIWDSTEALKLEKVPKTLLVVGGGYIGLEMATVYASLGSAVTVVEMLPNLLPGCDPDLANIAARRITKLCKNVFLNTKITGAKDTGTGLEVTFEGKGVEPKQGFENILVAVGRKPNSEGLGLEKTKARTDARGFIEVDAQRRTAAPTIFAIGDVAGDPMLAHKATAEGRAAAEAAAGKPTTFEPQAIPAVVFTDPEIAWCGLTESEAAAKKIPVAVSRFPWAASGRALTTARTDGTTKLVIDPKTERLLGMGIAGPGAGELIAEGVHAIEMGAKASDLGLTIHPHPTLSETIMEAADAFYGHATHIHRPKKKAPAAAPAN